MSTPSTTIALRYVSRSCVQGGVPLNCVVCYTRSAKQGVHTILLYTKKRHTTTAQTLKSQQHPRTQRQKGIRRQEQHLTTNQRPIPSKSHDSLRSPASRVSRRTDEAEAIATAVYAATSDAIIEDSSSGGHRRVYCAGRSPFFLPCVSALCTNGNTPDARTRREHPIYETSEGVTGRTSASDGRAHERVELLVAADGELEVARRYAFYAQVFRCVS